MGAGWFRGRTTSLDLLHSLCLQAGCYLYPHGNGSYVITAMDALGAANFTIGPGGSPNDYILYERGDPTRPGTSWRRTLRYRSGRSDQIRHAFELRYTYHSARQQFIRIAQASHLGTNDPAGYLDPETVGNLSTAYARYGTREPYLLDCDFIYDDSTAYALLALLVPYWMSPRQELEFESTMAPLAVLLGETILVDTPGMPPTMRGQVYEVDRLRYDFDQGRIFVHGTQRSLLTMDIFRIRDQEGTIWYWWIDGLGEQLVRSLTPPSAGHIQATDITPATIPYWLAILDETATVRYVYPLPFGQVQVQSTPPPIGTGYAGSPTWQVLRGVPYHLTTNQFLQYTVTQGEAP